MGFLGSNTAHGTGTRWLVSAALSAAALLVGCGREDGASTVSGPLGQASVALEIPNGAYIEKVDYQVRFAFLETSPPSQTIEKSYSTVMNRGELIAVLPCRTAPDGEGLNQVDISAKVWVRGRTEPFDAAASGVFTCVRNADTLVNVVLNVVAPLDAGFADLDVLVAGTLCAGKVDKKYDSYLGVCPQATCGRSDEVFIFANDCRSIQAAEPTYWLCGDLADWNVSGTTANAFFPLPDRDGSWTFGVIALDVFQMLQPDPTLTDPEGFVTVWSGVSASRAYIERRGGANVRQENAPLMYEFAAELQLAPLAAGQPSPRVIALVDQVGLGARVTWQTRFGPCDAPVEGVGLYPGMKVIDMRRDGAGKLKLLLGRADIGFAESEATCEAIWDETLTPARPTVTCGPQTPLID
jgi:hypothetical protein